MRSAGRAVGVHVGSSNKFGQFELGHIDQPQIRYPKLRDDDQRQQRMLHIGIVQRAAAFGHRRDHAVGLCGNLARRAVGHQPGDGQFDQRDLGAVLPDGHAAADLAQPVRGSGHHRAVGADDDHVVAVMRDGRGHRHPAFVAEARDEAVHHVARRPVPFDQRDLADAASRPRPHRRSRASSAVSALVGAWFSTTPMTLAVTAFAPSGAAISKSAAASVLPRCTGRAHILGPVVDAGSRP